MSISNRIEESIESWSVKWKDRLTGWVASTLGVSSEAVAKQIKPASTEPLKDILNAAASDPNAPAHIKEQANRLLPDWGPMQDVIGEIIWFLTSLTSIISGNQVFKRQWEQYFDSKERTYRLDPLSVITAWRRDPTRYAGYFDDLRQQGWSEDRIDTLKFFTQFYPSAQDLVTWTAREVFEPDAIEKYGLDDEFGNLDLSLFAGAGVSEDQARNYWRAHWQHPSFMQMRELLIRGLLTRSGQVPAEPANAQEWEARDAEGIQEMYQYYRLVENPPHWRDMLTESLFNVPTRVDVRRFWDMRVIDDQELRSVYHRQGYKSKDLDNYVLWTKVYTDFPVLLARWTNGWITEDDVRAELARLGMPEERIETMIQEKVKPEGAARLEDELRLTKTEIIKGVKNEVLTVAQGIELLMDLNKTRAEAEAILAINIEALRGSPHNFAEFKDLTTKWRQAVGKDTSPVTQEIKRAADRVAQLHADVANLELQIKSMDRQIIAGQPLPEETVLERTRLEGARGNAQIQLAEAQSRYADLVARWKHEGG